MSTNPVFKIQILQVGKTKESAIAELETEYEKRLQAFVKLETITFPGSKRDEREEVQTEEKQAFMDKLDSAARIIALDERGKQMTTEEFAELLRKERDFGSGKVQFLIGGSHGLHADVLASAHQSLSLSKMTFTHEMVRVFLKEQIYRAFTILAGKKYHK